MEGKRYFLIVAVPIFLLIFVLLGLSFYLQPFTGDLTRIGGYTENDFGWNEHQFGFKDIGTNYVGRKNAESEDYVVYGDSFSHWCAGNSVNSDLQPCFQWTAFFKKLTSLQGVTYHQDHYSVEELVQSIRGSVGGQKFIIFQSVERYAIPRLMSIAEGQECVTTVPSGIGQLSYTQTNENVISVDRLKTPVPFDMNIPSAYLKQLMVSFRKPRVLKGGLAVEASLFSNSKSNELLYHREDLNKTRYTEENYKLARCGMNVFAAKMQLEFGLPTFFLIAPDKSSVYGLWFKNKGKRVDSVIPKIADQNVNFVDLLSPMVAAANNGVTDIYLPNDTHWGARGGELAANTLANFIERKVVAFE